MERTVLGVTWRSTVKFQASTTGKRIVLSLVSGSTLGAMPFGRIGLPAGPFGCDARIVVGSSDCGPWFSVNTASQGLAGFSDWFANTGRFWVTLCPNETPKTPTSYERPYPVRMTVFGSAW